MLNKNISNLLALTKIALNSTDKSVSIESIDRDGIDWNYIVNVSKKQGVGAILIDAVKKFPSDQRPPKSLLLQWIGQMAMMEQMYAGYKEQIASLAEFYKQHDLSM